MGIHRRLTGAGSKQRENQALVAIWMLRFILAHHWVFKSFYKLKDGYVDSDVSDFLDLPSLSGLGEKKFSSHKKIKSLMKEKLVYFEKNIMQDSVLEKNIGLLAQRIQLTPLDQNLLMFAVLSENTSEWSDLFRMVNIGSQQQFMQVLACMFDVDPKAIKQSLSKASFLRQSQLITLDKSNYESGTLGMMNKLEEALLADNADVSELMAHFLVPSKPSTLTFDDYPHVKNDITLFREMIEVAIQKKDVGVNILLYGTPGTGKTELVRLLASELNLSLFEVKTEDEDGDAIRSCQRLGSYRLSQQLLAGDEQGLLLFDEVEGVFPARAFSFFGMEVKSGENKGWMNKTLEENTTPAIWVCNQLDHEVQNFLDSIKSS